MTWRLAAAVTALLVVALGAGLGAEARALSAARLRPAADDPTAFLIDGRYQRGLRHLAELRRRGELPDTITAGRCRYELAGDIAVAYYVRTCP